MYTREEGRRGKGEGEQDEYCEITLALKNEGEKKGADENIKPTKRYAGVKENVRRAEAGAPAIREEEKALFPFSRGPPHFD